MPETIRPTIADGPVVAWCGCGAAIAYESGAEEPPHPCVADDHLRGCHCADAYDEAPRRVLGAPRQAACREGDASLA